MNIRKKLSILFITRPLPDLMAIAWFVMRMVVAYLMVVFHGWGKFMRVVNGNLKFADPVGLGEELSLVLVMFAEFICSILVGLGFLTRLAVIPLITTMLVALLVQHGDEPISANWNIVGYLSVYFALLYAGAGRYSVDYRLWPAKESDAGKK